MKNDIYLEFNESANKEKNDTYFRYLQYLIDELNKIKEKIVTFTDSIEKNNMSRKLNLLINSLNAFKSDYNSYDDNPKIKWCENHITASYQYLDETGHILYSSLSVVALSRNLKYIYFVDELWPIFSDDDDSLYFDDYSIGYQEMVIYYIDYDNKRIYSLEEEREALTMDMYDNSSKDMLYMIKRLTNK